MRHATINDLPVGRSVDEAIRFTQALQFVEQHGEVCPANWNPGADTMKPAPVGSHEAPRGQRRIRPSTTQPAPGGPLS